MIDNTFLRTKPIDQPAILTASGITKDYATPVLHGVDLEIRAGEIHGLLGANGAGKSTLCKIIAGLVLPKTGRMTLDGRAYAPTTKQQAEAAGVQICQQELNLIPTLDVAHNLFFSRLPNRFGVIDRRRLYSQAKRLLDEYGLDPIQPETLVSTLGIGQQQMIEIASTLSRDCRLLILDEPTAALSPGETQLLVQHLRAARARGVGIIIISHRLDEVEAWTDRVTILRDGTLVGTYATASINQPAMIQWMTNVDSGTVADRSPTRKRGTPTLDQQPNTTTSTHPAMAVRRLTRRPALADISFAVQPGEVFGIGGLVGAGRTELLRAIFGADRADSGSIELAGVRFQPFADTTEAVSRGLTLVGEDRKADGLLLTQSITDNIALASLSRAALVDPTRSPRNRLGFFSPRRATALAQSQIQQLNIRCHDAQQSAGTLSGGNQQKVVLAKWLVRDGRVFLFDEPTRGIDVSARQQVYEIIRTLADAGKAIVVVSSDLEELIQVSDRIGIMSRGRWIGEYSPSQFDRVELVRAMFEGYTDRKVAATE